MLGVAWQQEIKRARVVDNSVQVVLGAKKRSHEAVGSELLDSFTEFLLHDRVVCDSPRFVVCKRLEPILPETDAMEIVADFAARP
jgi:hypothetical protein